VDGALIATVQVRKLVTGVRAVEELKRRGIEPVDAKGTDVLKAS
jgi:hypothetical protein